MSESLASIIARITALHATQGTPLDSFTDSRAADLSDLCADLGVPLWRVLLAQEAMTNPCRAAYTTPEPFGFDVECTLHAGHAGPHEDTRTDADARWEWPNEA